MEAELHLVPVARALGRGPDGPHDRLAHAAQVFESLAYLPLLEGELLLVAQVLEAAAAADARDEVRARGGHPQCRGRLDALEPRLGPRALDPRHARQHAVAGQAAIHEYGAALVPGQGLAAQRDVRDVEF